jgi:hypothetical protein
MFRFTLRESVLVTTIVALALGWWIDHQLTVSSRVVPPKWHGLLRTVVQVLQEEDLEIDQAQIVGIGVLSDSGTWRWHQFQWTPPTKATDNKS